MMMMVSLSVEALVCRSTYVNRNNEILQRVGAATARNLFRADSARSWVNVAHQRSKAGQAFRRAAGLSSFTLSGPNYQEVHPELPRKISVINV